MIRKIFISLFTLIMLFASGAMIAIVFISNNSESLRHVIKLHEVDQLRSTLVSDLKTVQADLYSLSTPFAVKIDSMVEDVLQLESIAKKCTSCHHAQQITNRLIKTQSLIRDYQSALSSYITMSATPERLEKLKLDAAVIGNGLLSLTENMSHNASDNLDVISKTTIKRVTDTGQILAVTVMATLILAVLISVNLKRSITKPIRELVNATRRLSSGDYGTLISVQDKTEFGELATHFNAMSIAVKEGYDKIRNEIEVRSQAEEALIKSEKFLRNMFDSIYDPFCIVDNDFRITRVNDSYAEMKHMSAEDLVGMRCFEVLYKRDSVCEGCVVKKSLDSRDPCAKDKLITDQNGNQNWLEIYTYPVLAGGRATHVIQYIRDITDRKLTEEALRVSEERYALAANGANDGLWDWNLKTNEVYYSERWEALIGLEAKKVSNSPHEWLNRVHPDDRVQLETEISTHINGHTKSLVNEHRLKNKEGVYRWMLCRGMVVRDVKKKAYRMAGSLTDISDRKHIEEQLMFDALHDSLTGLPNRALFMDRLSHALNHKRRHSEHLFAVLFLDIDRFKILNDSLGHAKGDELLVAISHRLGEVLRPGDTVARFGGDEFALLLEDLKDEEEAIRITTRIHEQISTSFDLDGQEIFTSASIGITYSSSDYGHPEHYLRDADIAMYHAKSKNSNVYAVFDQEMHANALARMQMETDLRQAINREEFLLYYQPIIAVETERIVGLEALIRWEHPVHGLTQPSAFIHVAEETGLIVKIGELVLRQACSQLRIWQDKFPSHPPLTMSANISSKQLVPNFCDQVKQVLEETGIEANSLILEITESLLMENAETAIPLFTQLKKMDIEIHIDDFGTGYSSLSYLHNFPIDVLKIDRSFVARMGINGDNMEIIRAITTLAENLNMKVTAEGVETEAQLEQLKSLQCKYVQGYLFSRPIGSKEMELLLEQGGFDFKKYAPQSAGDLTEAAQES